MLYLFHSTAMLPANHFICQIDKLRYAIPLGAQPRVEPNTYLMAGRRANHLATPHHNLATPHSLLSLYNDVLCKENKIPRHFVIAFSSANKIVSSWWPYIERLWVKVYLSHSHWWSLGHYITFFNRKFSHIIWGTLDNFLIKLQTILKVPSGQIRSKWEWYH